MPALSATELTTQIRTLKADITAKMTYQEFLAWCDEDTWAEWVDGEVIMLSPASYRHQDLADFLAMVMRIFAEARGLGVVCSAPFQMKTGPELPGREPDLLFVAREHMQQLKETYLEGAADLVVEIVSPESVLRDRGTKFGEYEMGGVQEYWLIDPERRRADFYVLDAEGYFQRKPPEAQGIYHSQALPGFWLRVDWLWQQPLPQVLDVLRELGVV
jgi:Uma2 family endonuclease